MRKMRNLLLTFMIGTLVSGSVLAQAEEGTDIPAKRREQQEKYDRGEGLYPAKKRSKTRIGLQGGYSGILGDVQQRNGYTGALDVEKALGHAVSIRGIAAYNFARGLNSKLSRGYAGHRDGNSSNGIGNAFSNPLGAGGNWGYTNSTTGVAKGVAYNHATKGFELGVQAMFHLGALSFYNERNKMDYFVGVGPSIMVFNTMIDAKKVTNGSYSLYDFESVFANAPKDEGKLFGKGSAWYRRNQIRKGLIDLLNSETPDKPYNYESQSESDAAVRFNVAKRDGFKKLTGTNIWNLFPAAIVSGGFRYRVNDLIELGLEERVTLSGTDLLDGVKWQERYGSRLSTPTTQKDVWSNTTVSVGFRLGKNGSDALWWVNPMNTAASANADGRKMMKQLSEDSDGDGVADIFDKDPNTPDGVAVNGAGQTLDMDQDGVADSQDDQPYTPKGCAVDGRGVAKDSDGDGVPDCLDKESGTKAGVLVDNNGKAINFPEVKPFDCSNCQIANPNPTPPAVVNNIVECNLPSVHFKGGGSTIAQEFYPDMYYVANYMMNHPGTSIEVIGNSSGNEAVARKRAEAAINFIVGNFGIDRSRFTIATSGGVKVGTGNSYKNPKTGPLDYLNDRVDFRCK